MIIYQEFEVIRRTKSCIRARKKCLNIIYPEPNQQNPHVAFDLECGCKRHWRTWRILQTLWRRTPQDSVKMPLQSDVHERIYDVKRQTTLPTDSLSRQCSRSSSRPDITDAGPTSSASYNVPSSLRGHQLKIRLSFPFPNSSTHGTLRQIGYYDTSRGAGRGETSTT